MATTRSARTTHRVRFGPRSAGILMTPEEFDAAPGWQWDDRYRYQLIRGVLVVSPPGGNAEVDPNEHLGYLLRGYQERHSDDSALDATMPERYVPGTDNRRRCDRAVWVGLGRLPDTEKDVPAIVIEFVSAALRDRVRDYEEKRDEYLATGVREYWIIDGFQRIMTIYENGPTGPVRRVVAETQSYESPLLPGFALPLAPLLSRADQWKKVRPRPQPKQPRKPPARGNDG